MNAILSLSRSRSEVLTDVRAKHAAAMRAANTAINAKNWTVAVWWLQNASHLFRWILELERNSA